MIEILKANEIPAGARILNGQGRALTGLEVARGVQQLVEREAGEKAAKAVAEKLANEWWPSMHLTFPGLRLEWCPCVWRGGQGGIWLRVMLTRGQEWEFQWRDGNADIRKMQELGPFKSPDDMRDALGLARIAQFRTSDGSIITAELPSAHPRQGPQKTNEEVLEVFKEVPQMAERPPETLPEGAVKPVETSVEDLLAEPPKVETVEALPPAEPAVAPKKVTLKKAAVRGRK